MLRVGRILHGTTAEGPGYRTAIWVQGCSIRCRGCINPHLFNPDGGEAVDLATIVSDAVQAGVEGITLLGGEPFDQSGALADLAELARAEDLGVICFTGYTHEHLGQRDAESARLLQNIDLLVDGPYVSDDREMFRSLVGSANQRFIHLTSRYQGFDPKANRNRVDIRVDASGNIEVAGFLSDAALAELSDATNARRTRRVGIAPRLVG